MKDLPNWLRASWDYVRTSLWLVPGLLFVAGAGLASMMLALDASSGPATRVPSQWLASGSGDDASNLLSTLLTAIITMASMAFSVTVVALSLAANSYGPRLIRLFRADLRTQLALGLFIMTIVYLLIVLRSIRMEMTEAEVPHQAVTGGVVLALVSVLALLAFIQVVARSIVADDVVRRVRREFGSAIDALPPLKEKVRSGELPSLFEAEAARIPLPREGYVQSVDIAKILRWAVANDCAVRLDFRPGDFVVRGDRKVLVFPPPPDPARARKEIDRFIVSGQTRTPTQDLEFAVRHLVEVAVRALSPGINDPYTAVAVIDRLRGALAKLSQKNLPEATMFSRDGALRIVRRTNDYAGVVKASLDQIRQAGATKPAILIHMLTALEGLAEHVRTVEQGKVIEDQADQILATGERALRDDADLADLREAHRRARGELQRADVGDG